jgi:glyoxylase-like metal-dependent hydrolase (beta-lactamase superfamily II)
MIETAEYGPVTQIRMSRELDGTPVYWVAAYLVDGLLIDTGCSHTSQELASFLEGRDLRQVVNTHYHEDHMGGNHDIMSRYGVDVYAHPDSIPLIADNFFLYPYQEIAWGYPVPTTVKPVPSILETDRHTFRVIETPGHCKGHICIMEPAQGWCFTGDLFARENPKFIRPEENISEMILSMRKVLDGAGERLVLFTAVGKIVEDGRKAFAECISHFTRLAATVKEKERSGSTVEDIVQDVFGGEHPFSELTNGQFSVHNLVRSLLETIPG